MATPSYSLWFVNDSGEAGTACVYLDASGVTTNQGPPTLLAWMVQSANPGVIVRFDWECDAMFLWSEPSPVRQQATGPVTPGARVTLSDNAFGLGFGTPTSGASEALTILQDASIPPGTAGVAGIGMHGAGTYGLPIRPNTTSQFTPAAEPPYRIAFGRILAEVDQPIDPATFASLPGSVSFPANVTVMTATIDAQNTWTVQIGPPGLIASPAIVYEAGRGLVSDTRPWRSGLAGPPAYPST